jgi:glyoxylase-like metal-dependent hydrolase (beta-lactamase superfamily II)
VSERPLPEVAEVQPGLWRIPLPIPGSPLGYVAVHAFPDGDGVVLVDAGWDAPETLAALEAGLGRFGARLADVSGIVVTHIHPDHYGLAGHIRELSGAWIAMHAAEAALIKERYVEVEHLLDEVAAWLREAGVPEEELPRMGMASMDMRRYVFVAPPDRLIEDGDRPEIPGWELEAVLTPGHSPGHLCFVDARRGVVVSGDHVLPRITPNVSYHPQSTADPLGDFLAALERLRPHGDLPALPSHGEPFEPLGKRLDELVAHHEERLDEILVLLAAEALTAWEVASRLRWSRPWETLGPFAHRSALGEAQAHLILLERRGRVGRVGERPARWRAA